MWVPQLKGSILWNHSCLAPLLALPAPLQAWPLQGLVQGSDPQPLPLGVPVCHPHPRTVFSVVWLQSPLRQPLQA